MTVDTFLTPAAITSDDWREALAGEFTKDYFLSLSSFCREQLTGPGKSYPPKDRIFAAFNLTPLSNVKVVILGQDPYHGPGQAMGLSFSVPADLQLPPSLRNIFNEISSDLGEREYSNGDLSVWARQGVLLLNSVLTVAAARAGSHRGRGWERFTDVAINIVSRDADHAVFMLWGKWAAGKIPLIDADKHLILEAPHPSPLSAYRGFFGCRHFSKANDFLKKSGRTPIDW